MRNIDGLSNEELKKFLEENSKEDQRADVDEGYDPTVNETVAEYEEEILSNKSQKKKDKKDSALKNRQQRSRERQIKKRRKALKKKNAIITRYDTDPELGLPSNIVESRIFDGLLNESINKSTKSVSKIIFDNIVTFFNILMFLIAAALIYVRAYQDLTFLVIVIANILIGIIQEVKAKKMIDNLSLMSSPTAFVIRDGVKKELNVNDVVLDDLLVLEAGKQICADSIVLSGVVEVDESPLTGESEPIVKNVGDSLFSGSFIISGKCNARVDKIGKDNYIEKLSSQAKVYKKPKSELYGTLKWIIRVMAFPVIIFGFLLFFRMYFQNYLDLTTAVRKTAASMIGMIPSGLFLMSSIALFVGVINLGQKNVLVQELFCIEMLARVNCICLDKTGTITDGTMVVKNVIDYNIFNGLATKNIISAMLNALHDSNLTSKALKDKFGLGKRIKHIGAIPFSSKRKFQAVTFEGYGTFILGAPEFVIPDTYKKYEKDVEKYANFGYRVLCLAHIDGTINDMELPSGDREVISMILIEDNIRKDAINTINYFKESGVDVRVISGDNPITVSKIAQRAGVVDAEKYISLDGLSDEEVAKVALRYRVFGRVSPSQKKIIIQTLKESGLTVAMTGDGVNDILALREADCSIALASGSEATRNCSHIVLMDSNFDSMPYIVSEGRRVINNVAKVASLFLTKTIFSLFLAIQAVFNGVYPISTNQFLLIDLLSIGIPSLFLVNEPNNTPVKSKFLYSVIREALPGALTILVISIIVFSLSSALYLDTTTRATLIMIAATHTCLMGLFKICRPFNTLRGLLCTFCYSVFLFAILFVPQFFEIKPVLPFVEYHSDTIKTEQITSYPKIEISKNNYYVINDYVISLKTNNNYSSPNLTAKINSDNKLHYAINDVEIPTEVNIPNFSFDANGKIYLGGYKVLSSQKDSSKGINYYDGIEKDLTINQDGYLYLKEKPVYIILDRANDYYDYKFNYGNYVEADAIRHVCLMPSVEVADGKYKINGADENYRVPTDSIGLSNINKKIAPKYDKDGVLEYYTLQINDKDIYKTNDNGTISSTPYTINVPNISTTLDNKNDINTLYLSGIDTNYSVFEIYGEEKIVETDKTYTITSIDNNEIVYNKTQDEITVNNVLVDSFKFDKLSTNGFSDYLDRYNNTINIYGGQNPLEVTVKENQTIYALNFKDNIIPLESCSLSNSFFAPKIEVTTEGMYIIDGYYTHYEAQSNYLNPQKDENNHLVIGGVTTDYIISNDNITTKNGGKVKMLDIYSLIFLIMLCLLASPLIRLFQHFIPWFIKQSKNLKNILTKVNQTQK